MTLSSLASFICGKVNQNEVEDLAACKGFLARRHEMLWNTNLWKDSLAEYRATLDPDTADYTVASVYLPTKGVLLAPSAIQRVMAVRSDARAFQVARQEWFYRMDYDAFAKTGTTANFVLLPACVWEFDTAQTLTLARGDAADAAISVRADLLDSDNVGVTRATVALAAADNALGGPTERVDSLQKAVTTGGVTLKAGGVAVGTVAPATTNVPVRQRIRLLEIPTAEVVLRVLGKRTCPAFSADADEPAIAGVENTLIAFALADMLERDENFTQADAKFKEGLLLLEDLKAAEVVQQAHNARITPAGGYGGGDFEPGRSGWIFPT